MGKTLSLEYPIYKRTPRKSYVNRVKEILQIVDEDMHRRIFGAAAQDEVFMNIL